jgi:hypothetical protein
MDILNKLELYYNNKYKEISKLLNLENNYKIDFIKTKTNKVLLSILNKNKLLFTGKFILYGIYQKNTKLWIWASSIPGININNIKKINKIKLLNYLFENSDNVMINFYYQLLTQDILLITDIKQLEWINRLLIFLNNDIYYFNPENNKDNNIQFIGLSSIIEKYI